tara:strand:- start:48 stop:773 length:726 start_codon:yes stop_codon:yes gene_type:complete
MAIRYLKQEEPSDFSMLSTGTTSYRKSRPRYTSGAPTRANAKARKRSKKENTVSNSSLSDYENKYSDYKAPSPTNLMAEDVSKDAADTLKGEWEKFVKTVYPMQDKIMDDIDRLDLTKDVREDVGKRFELGKATAKRNRERFGIEQTDAERQQMEGDFQRGESSVLAGELTDARLLTKDIKEAAEGNVYSMMQNLYNEGMNAVTSGGAQAFGKIADFQALKSRHKSNVANTAWNILRSWGG